MVLSLLGYTGHVDIVHCRVRGSQLLSDSWKGFAKIGDKIAHWVWMDFYFILGILKRFNYILQTRLSRANFLEETTPISPAVTFQCNNTVAVGKIAVSVLTALGALLRWYFQHGKLRGRGQKATSRKRKLLWLLVMVFTERENQHGNLVIQVDIYLHFKWPLCQIMGCKNTELMIHIMNKF